MMLVLTTSGTIVAWWLAQHSSPKRKREVGQPNNPTKEPHMQRTGRSNSSRGLSTLRREHLRVPFM